MWVFRLIQFLVSSLANFKLSPKHQGISHDCSFTVQPSHLGLEFYRSRSQQCWLDWTIKTFQRCQNNLPRKLRRNKGCHSKRWGNLLLLPQLAGGPAVNPTLHHSFTSTHKQRCHKRARSSGDAGVLSFATSHLQMATSRSHGNIRDSSLSAAQRKAILGHPALHPSAFKTSGLRWMRWGQKRDTIRAPCVSTAWIHTSSSMSHLFIQTILQPMALN